MDVQVKSAVRVLQVLDYFDAIERAATVNEIARALGAPMSSTSILLRQMQQTGYLDRDSRRRYTLSIRVATLGRWSAPFLDPDGPVLRLMHELRRATSEFIILGAMRGDMVRYIYTLPSVRRTSVRNRTGTALPVATSCVGRMFMAGMSEHEVRRLVFQHNRKVGPERQIGLPSVLSHLGETRLRGYARSPEVITTDTSGLAIRLPEHIGPEPLVLAIGSVPPTIHRHCQEWAKLMIESLDGVFRSAGDSSAGWRRSIHRTS